MELIVKAKDIFLEYAGRDILDIEELEIYSYEMCIRDRYASFLATVFLRTSPWFSKTSILWMTRLSVILP